MIHPLLFAFPGRRASFSFFSEVYNEFISWNHHSSSRLRSLLSFSVIVAVFPYMYNTVSSAYFMTLGFLIRSVRSLRCKNNSGPRINP